MYGLRSFQLHSCHQRPLNEWQLAIDIKIEESDSWNPLYTIPAQASYYCRFIIMEMKPALSQQQWILSASF